MPKTCNAPGCSNRVWGKGFCNRHQYMRTDKKQKKIKPFSVKRTRLNRIYDAEAKLFREDNPECVIKSPDCVRETQGVHHVKGRGKYLLTKRFWKASCNPCNHYVETHHAWALENGHKEGRLKIEKAGNVLDHQLHDNSIKTE